MSDNSHIKRLRRILPLLGLLLAIACAPRINHFSSADEEEESEENQLNREALETLRERGEQTRRAEPTEAAAAQSAVVQAPVGQQVPVLPVTVLQPDSGVVSTNPSDDGPQSIERQELLAFLERGPHTLLSAVVVEPVLDDSRFRGFRVRSIDTTFDTFARSGLLVGDVVLSVNGRDVSRPENFMALWDSIDDADALEVDIMRGGEAQTLIWPIL